MSFNVQWECDLVSIRALWEEMTQHPPSLPPHFCNIITSPLHHSTTWSSAEWWRRDASSGTHQCCFLSACHHLALPSAATAADNSHSLSLYLTVAELWTEHHSLGVGDGDTVDQGLQPQVEVDERGLHADLGHAQPEAHVLAAVLHEEGNHVAILWSEGRRTSFRFLQSLKILSLIHFSSSAAILSRFQKSFAFPDLIIFLKFIRIYIGQGSQLAAI